MLFRLVVLLLALLSIGAAPAKPKPFQRVVLTPGCYVLAKGGFYDISAYCLDESMPAPAPGTTLTGVPDSLGRTVIKTGATVTSLQTALQRGVIRLEGLGGADYFHVRVRNLSADKIEICVTTPTVLLGDEGYPTADLKKIYPQLAPLMTQAGGPVPANGNEALETHLKIQKKIWAAMAEIAPKPDDSNAGSWPGPAEGSKRGIARPQDCDAPPDTVVACPVH